VECKHLGREANPKAGLPGGRLCLAFALDGHHLAFILREDNLNAQEASREPGVWVLEMATLQANKALDDRAASSTLAGWTPDGQLDIG